MVVFYNCDIIDCNDNNVNMASLKESEVSILINVLCFQKRHIHTSNWQWVTMNLFAYIFTHFCVQRCVVWVHYEHHNTRPHVKMSVEFYLIHANQKNHCKDFFSLHSKSFSVLGNNIVDDALLVYKQQQILKKYLDYLSISTYLPIEQ